MTDYYLGADLGGTKTHIMISDQSGNVIGFGESGTGNHEMVGYEGMRENLTSAAHQAFTSAGIKPVNISGSGFGVAGFDWPNQKKPVMGVINTLDLGGRLELVNDTVLGILAGSPRGWGIAVVSGTGCNCWGWDKTRSRIGRVTGGGAVFGENAGASELLFKATSILAKAWTTAGPPTALTDVFCRRFRVNTPDDLLQGLLCGEFEMHPSDALLVFETAKTGDPVTIDLIRWVGRELGEMACAVIHQLNFEDIDFDLVQIGSMFDGSPLIMEEMKLVILQSAPHAHFIRLQEHPVIGAVLLGMEAARYSAGPAVRKLLTETSPIRQKAR